MEEEEEKKAAKLAGAEELFVLFGRLRYNRLRAGLMNVACNGKEVGYWPFSTWCLDAGSGGEDVVDECSSGSSVTSAGPRDVSVTSAGARDVSDFESDDAEFLQEEMSRARRIEKKRDEREVWWNSLTSEERLVELEWEAYKAMHVTAEENCNAYARAGFNVVGRSDNASEPCQRGRSLDRLAREGCRSGVRLRLCGGSPKKSAPRRGRPKKGVGTGGNMTGADGAWKKGLEASLEARKEALENHVGMKGVESREPQASASEVGPRDFADGTRADVDVGRSGAGRVKLRGVDDSVEEEEALAPVSSAPTTTSARRSSRIRDRSRSQRSVSQCS